MVAPFPVAPDQIRAAFSMALSEMYRSEVPLYGALIDIVADINAQVLAADPRMASDPARSGALVRLGAERHGAIRLGTAAELSMMRRAFAILGMYPVGYYDLAEAGVPVHSTAFRPIDIASLARNPFRVFTSLLRVDAIEDATLRDTVVGILATRQIFSGRALALIERAEIDGGLGEEDAGTFVRELIGTFRWQSEALVDAATYERLNTAHRLVADVVSFRGPHINHLTPRTLDIDAAQTEMGRRGIEAKEVIEGPPRRAVPILLRQTSFKALEEEIRFVGQVGDVAGSHTARFGEIEQRGAALTPKGRRLYDALLGQARHGGGREPYDMRLARAFRAFPDSEDALRREGLAYFSYALSPDREATAEDRAAPFDPERLIERGVIRAEPLVYEDFLPVSAAGIFQSNLGGTEGASLASDRDQRAFEAALGAAIIDPFALYEAVERTTLEQVRDRLRSVLAFDVVG